MILDASLTDATVVLLGLCVRLESPRIFLFEPMQSYVDEQVTQGRHSSVDEYLQALIDQDQQRRKAHLETKLLEGFNSGEPTPMTMQDWSTIREAVKANLQHHGED